MSIEPDRAAFFAAMRPLFGGTLSQGQVDQINRALAALFGSAAGSNLKPVSVEGLKLIQSFEGLHDGDTATATLEPMRDPIGIYTIGWGYALFDAAGAPVKDKAAAMALWRRLYPAGMTRADADALMLDVVASWTPKLGALLDVALSQHESDALISLAYNIGIGIKDGRKGDLADSSLLAALNRGDRKRAADHFRDWVYAGGKRLSGLVRRRETERAHFLKPD